MSDIYTEKYGNTVEEAVNLALKELGITEEEAEISVLDEPSRGFFGIGSKLALVRVEKKEPKKEEKKSEKPKENDKAPAAPVKKEKAFEKKKEEKESELAPIEERLEKRKAEKASEKKHESKNNGGANFVGETIYVSKRPENLEAAPGHPAEVFLKELIEKMGLSAEVDVRKNEEYVYVDLSGKDCGTIIGKRGQTLDAIQYLTSLVVNKGEEEYIRLVVDAENYRAKREKTLVQLANRLADKALRTKKSIRLEPMNPYERKVIHATLQQKAGVVTRSEGEEPHRRVVISLK